jgi:hypothetical protein
MSKAPPVSRAKLSARARRLVISSLRRTGAEPAPRLIRVSSESSLCGLMVRSMRCISAMTASIAASPAAASSLQSSTTMAVPMIACSRFSQPMAVPGRAGARIADGCTRGGEHRGRDLTTTKA